MPAAEERPTSSILMEMSRDSGGSSLEQPDSTDVSNSTTDTVRSNPNLHVNGVGAHQVGRQSSEDEQAPLASDPVVANSQEHQVNNKPVITGALMKEDVQEDTFQVRERVI